MDSRPAGSVYRRCGCREGRSGRRRGTGCPRLCLPGHGSWYFSVELPRDLGGPRRRVRRGGYRSRTDAIAARDHLAAAAAGLQ